MGSPFSMAARKIVATLKPIDEIFFTIFVGQLWAARFVV